MSTTLFGILRSNHNILERIFNNLKLIYVCVNNDDRNKLVPVTTAWRVLGLRMEERPPTWRVAANILNKQSRTADGGWPYSFGVGRGANNS